MITRDIHPEALGRTTIDLGHAGEKNRTQIRFDCSRIYAEIPGAAAALTVRSPAGETYPVATTLDGSTLVWIVSASDTAWTGKGDGYGKLQLTFSDGDQIAKTYEGQTVVHESLGAPGPAPSGVQTWLDQANLTLAELPIEIQNALREAKQSGEFDGVGIASIEKTGTSGLVDTYTITMTDGEPYTFTVTNGRDGQDGHDGAPGADGQDGKDGKDGQDGAPGQDGHDGAPGQDGQDGTNAYVWIRYAAAQPTADADMKTTPDAWIGIYSGDAATAPEHYTDYTWYKVKGEPGAVQDVKLNGTSVLQNGEAKIPTAGLSRLGVVSTNSDYGVTVGTGANAGRMQTSQPSATQIKEASSQYRPITPSLQHRAVFYGLPKAAGDTSQAQSDNELGQYTDAAKVAIQKMLGIYEAPWELIREDTVTNAIEADIEITVDAYGEPFELTDFVLMFETPVQETASGKGEYGRIKYFDGATLKVDRWASQWTQNAGAAAHGMIGILENHGGMCFYTGQPVTESSKQGNLNRQYKENFTVTQEDVFYDADFKITKAVITKVTGTGHYKLYGKRKWN